MVPKIVKDAPGRPITGSEAKSEFLKIRIERTLLDELTYACRSVGMSVSQGVRQGIIMFIKECSKHYG